MTYSEPFSGCTQLHQVQKKNSSDPRINVLCISLHESVQCGVDEHFESCLGCQDIKLYTGQSAAELFEVHLVKYPDLEMYI